MKRHWLASILLIAGDLVMVGLVTVVGFATHDRLEAGGASMLTTFIPVTLAWVLIGIHVKVFDYPTVLDGWQLWRPFWAMILAAPLAGFLRAAWLNRAVAPLFIVVLGGFSALAILAWRIVYWGIARWRKVRAS